MYYFNVLLQSYIYYRKNTLGIPWGSDFNGC